VNYGLWYKQSGTGTNDEELEFSPNSLLEGFSATATVTVNKVNNKSDQWTENRFPHMETKHSDRLNSLYRLSGLKWSNSSQCNGKAMLTSGVGFSNLSLSVVNSVEKFVFFVGYARSGHSMIGSVMDAHPDMVIAHEYFLFDKCVDLLKQSKDIFKEKVVLFNSLFANSFLTSKCGWRSDTNTVKGYNFNLNLHWQGTFNQLRVIGDKSGNSAAHLLATALGQSCLQNMVSLNVPLVAIHVVRNPYDMIATSLLYAVRGPVDKATLGNTKVDIHVSRSEQLQAAKEIFRHAGTISKLSSLFSKHLTVIEVHIEDYIQSPRTVIEDLCHSLGVDCPQDYVEECGRKAYSSISRSRDLITWSHNVRYFVQQQIKRFPFFSGYSFEDDFRHHT
jgi:hypothetical protein